MGGVLLSLLALSACLQDEGDACLPCQQVREVNLQLAGIPAGLETPLYVFRRKAGTQQEYVLARSFESVADGERIRLPLADLDACDFRFVMVAQPADGEWLSLQTADGALFAPGGGWSDLRLVSPTGRARAEGYCGVVDKSGAAILSEGKISLTLTRVAGQMLFDFYRGTPSAPEGVVASAVASVLDRVTRIDIEYDTPTTSLRFDADNRLVPAACASVPFTDTILPEVTDFKVSLPQDRLGLGVYDASLRGSLRMAGAFLLPSDNQVCVKLLFTYYDTTPSCDNNHTGGHVASCYGLRQVELRLPAASATTGLPVAADFFTVNRAGLRCDRIIDVPVGGTVTADFDWKNGINE